MSPLTQQPEGGQDAYTRDRMQQIARMVDDEIPFGWGFLVMVFPRNGGDGRMNYVSNARREDVHEVLRAFLQRGGATFDHSDQSPDRRIARLEAEKDALKRNLGNLLSLTSTREQPEIDKFIEEILRGVVVL